MKILGVDIETSPNLAHVWGLWQQNVGLNQLEDVTEVLCWSAKFFGEGEEMHFSSSFWNTKEQMVGAIWKLLDEADVVVHYNGKRFDIPHLNREFLELGLTPPSPFKQIDLLQTVKRQFRFPSNKLDYVTKALGLGQKVSHTGFGLWKGCMEKDPNSWEKMKEYNIQDVLLLEELYNRLLPWVPGHPNRGLYDESDVPICRCGSTKLIKQGYAYTSVSKFQQYQCKDCGAWSRGRKNLADRENVHSNVVG